jgi:hypothetical protein
VVWCDGMCGDGASQASKADVQAKNLKGETPLHYASSFGHDKVAQLLVVRKGGSGRTECVRMSTNRGGSGCGGGRMSAIGRYGHTVKGTSGCIYLVLMYLRIYLSSSVWILMHSYVCFHCSIP